MRKIHQGCAKGAKSALKNTIEEGFIVPPLPSPPFVPYIPFAVREGGYGDKWASE